MVHQTAAMDGPPFVQGLFKSIESEARMCGPRRTLQKSTISIELVNGITFGKRIRGRSLRTLTCLTNFHMARLTREQKSGCLTKR